MDVRQKQQLCFRVNLKVFLPTSSQPLGGFPLMRLEEKMSEKHHCCGRMKENLAVGCEQHSDVFDCPDTLVYYSDRFDEYGLIIHDGGSSCITIHHCPWCGAKLPESRRDEWFDRLEAMGYSDPSNENVPKEFLTSEWYGLVDGGS